MMPEPSQCRSCGAAIWWRTTPKGRLQPMNVDPKTRTRTDETHYATCPQARQWRRRR